MSRSFVRYEDEYTKVDVAAEMLASRPVGYVIYVDTIPPDAHMPREEIADRILRAFAIDGSQIEIVGNLDPDDHA